LTANFAIKRAIGGLPPFDVTAWPFHGAIGLSAMPLPGWNMWS
jgi:hypothetical protein